MDINKASYWVLVTGMVVSMFFLALSLISNISGVDPLLSTTLAAVGVGVLIATPYARVIAIAVLSAFNRDRGLFVVASFVLTVMLLSLLFGLIFHITPKG